MPKVRHQVIWLERGWQCVYIGFCPSAKAWRKLMRRLKQEDERYPTADGRTTTFVHEGRTYCVVTVSDRLDEDRCGYALAGLLVHEGTHVWQHVLEDMGEKNPSSEFEAYSLQAICQGLMCAFSDTRYDLFS
jgi:hypothetical protein